jgi:O-antigen/teichoic acid export membrane protein
LPFVSCRSGFKGKSVSMFQQPSDEPGEVSVGTPAPHRRVALNMIANTVSTALNAFCGFLILPFLVSRLGRETYGFWVLIVATAGYFLVLDFGVSGAVGRLVAGHRSKDAIRNINIVISTTAVLLLALCAVVVLLSYFLPIPFFALFEVPAAEQSDVARALLIVGVTTALSFPGMISYGFLWGYERFDVHNLIEIPVVLARTALTFIYIQSGSQLTELALIVSGTSIAGYILRTALCWWVEPRLRLRLHYFSLPVLKEMFVFGIWFGLLSLTRSLLPNVSPFVIGHSLGPGPVTTYTIPRLLIAYSHWMMVSATTAVAPHAAVYHFSSEREKQQQLFLLGGRYTFALSLFVLGGAVLFGSELLSLWQGAPQPEEYRLLLILMAGEVIPLSQWITYNMIVSMGVHRRLAIFGILEALSVLALSVLLVRVQGLEGVAIAVATAGLLFRGILQLRYGCRLVSISSWRYVQAVFLPILLWSGPAFLVIALYRLWVTPDSWVMLGLSSALYAGVYGLSLLPVLRRTTMRSEALPG